MIEIPGYRIVRQIGRGGMASVHLAIQQSVDREVALKIMSPQLNIDQSYGERFLREARIAAKLQHRHVVGVHDVGRHGDYHYIAMEYLDGGPVLAQGREPGDPAFALRVTREIASALGYAHSKGFVHRDVKPDNILLRDDGAAALTDFGIARAADSVALTRTGAVVGTPHYMSPEQARGKATDGRSDLYSLGIVLYELLIGRVPYQADDSLAVGIMHITEPLPRLPPPFEELQPLLDGLLAKQPENRFQTGDEAALAVQELEFAFATGQLPRLPQPSAATRRRILDTTPLPGQQPDTRTVPTPPEPATVPSTARGEPRIGRIDNALIDRERTRPRADDAPRNRGTLRFVAAVLALTALVAGLWANQDRLRALLPETEVNTLLVDADAALAQGRLSGPGSATMLYAKVLELDPDNTRAIEGRRAVGERLVGRANEALAAQRVDEARALAAEARAMLGGGEALASLEAALTEASGRNGAVEALLARARAAQNEQRIAGAPDSALTLYRDALAADPDNALALNGLVAILDALALDVHAAISTGELGRAGTLIEEIAAASANHPRLPELRAAHADAGKRAERDALERRRRGEGLLVQANAAIDANDPGTAGRLIREAGSTGVAATELAVARTRLAELIERNEITANAEVSAERAARAAALIAQAEAAIGAGNLMDPPGENAYDKYREALGADPRNARAQAGLRALPAKARELFTGALGERRLGLARQYLDVVEAVRRDDTELPRMRRELALALLAQAERQIGDGQLDSAQRSIAKARELAPAEPGVAAAETRLAAARGG